MKRLLSLAACLSISGCVIMTPSPAMQALQLAGAVTVNAVSVGPFAPDNEVIHEHESIKEVCIEFNQDSSVVDFVPALQTVLIKQGVVSRVYRASDIPSNCRYTMHYTAYLRWEKQLFGDGYMPCMNHAQLVLRENGRVLASAGYAPGVMSLDLCSSTQRKLEPSVRAILSVKAPIDSKSPAK